MKTLEISILNTYTFINAGPVVEVLPCAVLLCRVIAFNSLNTLLTSTTKENISLC